MEDIQRFRENGKFCEYENDILIETVDLNKKDSAKKYDDEREAEFPGGNKAWTKYIIKSLEKSEAAIKSAKGGKVILDFVIGVNGEVQEAHIMKSVEFLLDEDSLEIIRKSPKWNAAWQDGHSVKSYNRQPIIYAIPE